MAKDLFKEAGIQPKDLLAELRSAPTTIPGFTGPVPAQAGPTEEAILPQSFTEPAGRFTPRAAGGLLNIPEGLLQTASMAMETAGGLPPLPIPLAPGRVPQGTTEALTNVFEGRRAGLRERFPGTAGTAGEITGEVSGALSLPVGRVATTAQSMIPLALQKAHPLLTRLGLSGGIGGLFGATRLSEPTVGGKLKDVATGIPFGVGAGAVGEGLRGAAGLRHPIQKAVARSVRKRLDTRAARKAAKTIKETDLDALIGQRIGSADISAVETQASRGVIGKDKIIQDFNSRLKTLAKFLTKTMDKIHPDRATSKTVGNSIVRGTHNAVKIAKMRRDAFAQRDYGEFRKLGGTGQIIPVKNFQNKLKEITDDVAVGDKGEKFARRALRLLDKQMEEGKITAEQLRKYRSSFSDAAKGTGNLWKDIADANTTRIGREVMKAIEKDFDSAVKLLGQGKQQNVAKALKTANDNFAKNSKLIDDIEESVLGKLVGKPGKQQISDSQVAKKLIASPSEEIKAAFKILSPFRQQRVKRFIIENAINKATGKDPFRLITEKDFKPETVFREITKIGNLRDVFSGPQAREELRGVIQALKAIKIVTGTEVAASTGASPIGAAADIASAGTSGSGIFIMRYGVKILSPIGLRKTLYTQEGREAVMALAKAVKGPKATFTKTAAPAIAFFDQLDTEEENGN